MDKNQKIIVILQKCVTHHDADLAAEMLDFLCPIDIKESKILDLIRRLMISGGKPETVSRIVDACVQSGLDISEKVFSEKSYSNPTDEKISMIDLLLTEAYYEKAIELLRLNRSDEQTCLYLNELMDREGQNNSFWSPKSRQSIIKCILEKSDINQAMKELKIVIELGLDVNRVLVRGAPAFAYVKNNEQLNLLLDSGADPLLLQGSGKTMIDFFSRVEDTKERALMLKTYEHWRKKGHAISKEKSDLLKKEEAYTIERAISNKKVGIQELRITVKGVGSTVKDFNYEGKGCGYWMAKNHRFDLLSSAKKDGVDIIDVQDPSGLDAIIFLMGSSALYSYTELKRGKYSIWLLDQIDRWEAKSGVFIVEAVKKYAQKEASGELKMSSIGDKFNSILMRGWLDRKQKSLSPEQFQECIRQSLELGLLYHFHGKDLVLKNSWSIEAQKVLSNVLVKHMERGIEKGHYSYNKGFEKEYQEICDWIQNKASPQDIQNTTLPSFGSYTLISFLSKCVNSQRDSLGIRFIEALDPEIKYMLNVIQALEVRKSQLNMETTKMWDIASDFDQWSEFLAQKNAARFLLNFLKVAELDEQKYPQWKSLYKKIEPKLGTIALCLLNCDTNGDYEQKVDFSTLLNFLINKIGDAPLDGFAPELAHKVSVKEWTKSEQHGEFLGALEKMLLDLKITNQNIQEGKKTTLRL